MIQSSLPSIYISSNLLECINSTFEDKRNRYYAIGLVGFMCYTCIFLKNQRNFKFGLAREFWAKIIGSTRLSKILNELKNNDILICDESYMPLEKCKNYSLSERFTMDDFFLYREHDDIIKNKNGQIPYGGSFYKKVFSAIEKNKENLPIEFRDLKNKYIEKISLLSIDKSVEKEFARKLPKMSEKQRELARRAIDDINNKKIYSTPHVKTGRQFNSITCMPKWVRYYLRYEGESLCEIDMAQCQPTLLSTFYKDTPRDLSEKSEYIDFLKSNRVYDYFNNYTKYPSQDPEIIKKRFIAPLFASLKMQNAEVCKLFFEKFPILGARITEIKKENYKNLATALQKTEANLFVNQIFIQCDKENIFAITLHDGILCRKKDKVRVKEIITQKCQEIIGCTPILKDKMEEI